jgi:hypothetical protein
VVARRGEEVKAALLALLLAGCASGVRMSDAQRIECRNEGCVAVTERQVIRLVERAIVEGYKHGWRDANKQAGREL